MEYTQDIPGYACYSREGSSKEIALRFRGNGTYLGIPCACTFVNIVYTGRRISDERSSVPFFVHSLC